MHSSFQNSIARLSRAGFLLTLTITLVVGCSSSSGTSAATSQAAKLEVHIINVGQGDAILIRCPHGNHEILIDSGELNQRYPQSATMFKSYLGQVQPTNNTLEVVIGTHPHSDHIGSMQWVVDTYTIGLYIDDGVTATSATWNNLETKLASKNVPRAKLNAGMPNLSGWCNVANVKAEILRPNGLSYDSDHPNDNSVVLRLQYGSTSFLFVGDSEDDEEEKLVFDQSTQPLLDVDFLKVGHHASETSSKAAFLSAVTPKIMSVSCGVKDTGSNKQFKHPRAKTLRALLPIADPREGPALDVDAYDSDTLQWVKVKLNSAVYVTSVQGDMVFESDGTTIHKR